MTEKKNVRVQLVMSASELEALDAWRAPRRIWSRSAAVRQIIEERINGDAGDEQEVGDGRGAGKAPGRKPKA